MDERQLVAGYRALLSALYTDDAYHDRCELYLDRTRIGRTSVSDGAPRSFARAVWTDRDPGPAA